MVISVKRPIEKALSDVTLQATGDADSRVIDKFLAELGKLENGSLPPRCRDRLQKEAGRVSKLISARLTRNHLSKEEILTFVRGLTALKRNGICFDARISISLIGTLVKEFDEIVHSCSSSELAHFFEMLEEYKVRVKNPSLFPKTLARVQKCRRGDAEQEKLQDLVAAVFKRSEIALS